MEARVEKRSPDASIRHRRRPSVCLLGVLAPPAAAKELQGATICGAERCVDVPKDDLGFELIEGNSYATPPKHAERFYRVELRIGGGGHHETFELVLLPRLAYLSDFGGRPNTWLALYDDGARIYRQLTAPLEPFPAADTARMLAAADSGPDREAAQHAGRRVATSPTGEGRWRWDRDRRDRRRRGAGRRRRALAGAAQGRRALAPRGGRGSAARPGLAVHLVVHIPGEMAGSVDAEGPQVSKRFIDNGPYPARRINGAVSKPFVDRLCG